MRVYILIAVLIFALSSCTQKSKIVETKPDHVSKWFKENEDSLYSELVRLAEKNLIGYDQDKIGYTSNHQPPETYMGKFTDEVKKGCDGLQVTFSYNKSLNPRGNILVSTGYNRKCAGALDSILNFDVNPKHFIVEKYDDPGFDSTTDVLTLDMGDLPIKDIRIKMTPFEGLQDITVYIPGKLSRSNFTEADSLFMRSQLFGEKMFVRKINSLNFSFSDTIKSDLLTIYKVRSLLK